MIKIRCLYTKTGRAKFISHLDLMETFKRSFLRAGVKLTYSEGFNPHPYISVALPLSVGCESVCEIIDVGFSGKGFPKNINEFLPEGLSILEVYSPERKFSNIKWVKVSCILHYFDEENASVDGSSKSKETLEETALLAGDLFAKEHLSISKKTKSGVNKIDIAPHIKYEYVRVLSGSKIEISAIISAQNPTVSQNDFLTILGLDEKIKTPSIFLLKRIEIYDGNMLEFR
ncbi:MAG: TIGR03936 family radical SAM-associated protein [Oscillospiraceae bacterium]|nr:TIGR03936 family radical SAM-associated protein [Oscillospiraceae bacterium]